MFNYKTQDGNVRASKVVGHIVIGLVALILFFGSVGNVSQNQIGVKTRFGKVVTTLQAVAKWDGHLPAQMVPNASVPFLNLK